MPDLKYHKLSFKNGYAYRECTIPLADQGLVLLRGVNADDGGFLGAGKSSIFEVLSQLLIGKGGKQKKGERHLADDIINQAAGEDFEARLRLDIAGRPFEIIQYRKHCQYGNSFRVIDLDSGRNIIPYNNRKQPQAWFARQVLQIDEKSLFNFIYLAQDFNNVMLYGTDGERLQSLIQMFGLDVYDDLLKLTKAKLMTLKTSITDLALFDAELKEIESKLENIDPIEQLETELEIKKADYLALQQKHDAAVDNIDRLQTRLRELDLRAAFVKEIKQLWSESDLPVDSIREVDEDLASKLQKVARTAIDKAADLRSSLRTLEQRSIIEERLLKLGKCEDLAEVQAELDRTKDELRKLTNSDLPAAEKRAEITQDLRGVVRPEKSASILQEMLDAARGVRQTAELNVATIKSQLDDEVCPTCLRPFNLSAKETKTLEAKLVQARASLTEATQRVHTTQEALNSAEHYEELRARLRALPEVGNPSAIQREISRLTKAERRLVGQIEAGRLKETLEVKLATLPTGSEADLRQTLLQMERQAKRDQVAVDVARSIADLRNKLANLPKGKAGEIKSRLAKLNKALKKYALKIARLGSDVGVLEQLCTNTQELINRRNKLKKALKQSKKIRLKIKCLSALETCFGSKGLKRDRFKAILDDATKLTVPHYADLLWPRHNAFIDLVDEGNAVRFELRRRKGLSVGSRLLSGGERNKAGLALLFGLRDLKENYTNLHTNLLIVDEPFGNMDPHGTGNLLQLLEDLRQRIGTVVVIGNQRDVLTYEGWDQIWWAVRRNHEAKLYVNDPPDKIKRLADSFIEREL